VSFRLAYETGANIVDDRMAVSLRPDWFWQVDFGIQNHDPCGEWPNTELCRSYSLPRDIDNSGDGQLYVAWRGSAITVPTE
jgi:hypothetical protein